MSIVSDIIQGKAALNIELFKAKCQELGFDNGGGWCAYREYKCVKVVLSYVSGNDVKNPVKCHFVSKAGPEIVTVVADARFIVLSNQTIDDLVDQYIITQRYYDLYQSSVQDLKDKLS